MSTLRRWARAIDVLWRRYEVEIVYRFTLALYVGIVALFVWGVLP